MRDGADAEARIETIRTYFRRVDADDPRVLDLFTEDAEIFFPKFGRRRGKAAVAAFSDRVRSHLAHLDHDIAGLTFVVSGDIVVAEGREWGVTRDGVHWPDGVISEGLFCNVFAFEGPLIRRCHIYVDPDFTGADAERLRIFAADMYEPG